MASRTLVTSIVAFIAVALMASTAAAQSTAEDREESRWHSARAHAAIVHLRKAKGGILVVPVQNGEHPFDLTERSLITRLVTDRIAFGSEHDTFNPTLVIDAFMPDRSSFASEKVAWIADQIGASETLVLTISRTSATEFELTASLRSGSHDEIRGTSWPGMKFDHESPPSISVRPILDSIVEFVDGKKPTAARKPVADLEGETGFGGSYEEFQENAMQSSLASSLYLQTLAALHPGDEGTLARNRLFERSLVELSKVDSNNSLAVYLSARAYAYLDRRPVAMKILANRKGRYISMLRDTLNGNLSSLHSPVEALGADPLDLMAWRDYLYLHHRYHLSTDDVSAQALVDENPAWAPFIERSIRDMDSWASYNAVDTHLALDALSIDSKSTESIVVAAALLTSDLDEVAMTRSVLARADDLLGGREADWAKNPELFTRVTAEDVADLARATMLDNHRRRVIDDLDKRDLPDRALKRLNEFDPIFADHAALLFLRSRANAKMRPDAPSTEKGNLYTNEVESGRKALLWSPLVSIDSASFGYETFKFFPPPSGTTMTEYRNRGYRPYRYDEWPKGRSWFRRISAKVADYDSAFERCLLYSWASFSCVQWWIEREERESRDAEARRAQLLEAYDHRFNGSPIKASYQLDLAKKTGGQEAHVQALKVLVDNGTRDWSPYQQLGLIHKRNGKYQLAFDALMAFPGFKDPSGYTNIEIGHYANLTGSWLYWIGQHELAHPLLGISAATRSGSESTYQAGARMALIDSDFESAMSYAATRVRRYGSAYAARDLLELFHMVGDGELAWESFDQLRESMPESHLWSSALVGHRKDGRSDDDIVEWLLESDSRKIARNGSRGNINVIPMGPRFLILNAMMDRSPNKSLYDQLRSVRPGNRWILKGPVDNQYSRPADKLGYVQFRGGMLVHDPLLHITPRPKVDETQVVRIDSWYESMARPLVALRNGDCKSAFDLWDAAASMYRLYEFLPYHSFCAARIGKTQHIRNALAAREAGFERQRLAESDRRPIDGYRFDEDLSLAVIAAFDGDHAQAMALLRRALDNRPYLNDRTIYPMYAVVDIAELLHDTTGESRYADFALDLARRHTVVLPTHAWAYFVVATHTEADHERLINMANGLYLDPLSRRASQLPNQLRNQAEKYLSTNGPPLLNQEAVRRTNET